MSAALEEKKNHFKFNIIISDTYLSLIKAPQVRSARPKAAHKAKRSFSKAS